MPRRILMVVLIVLSGVLAGMAHAADSAVVLMYHRFGDDRFPTTSIRLDQFDEHVAELTQGGYVVLPLPRIVEALESGRPLPDRAIAITIDDAWASVYRHAWPRLKAAGMPFTIFVVTDETDRGGPEMMSWDQLRELQASGLVTLGTQGAAHPHMPALSADAIAADLARARDRMWAELGGVRPELLAWPFGEASAPAFHAARSLGFKVAFGQHSGVAWKGAERFFLPRFPLNETYGEIERFRLAVNALPLPAVDITPDDPHLDTNPPAFGFTIDGPAGETMPVSCFSSHEGKVRHERLGPRVEIRLSKPFASGRGRINCTSPGKDGRWRWFGWQFSVP